MNRTPNVKIKNATIDQLWDELARRELAEAYESRSDEADDGEPMEGDWSEEIINMHQEDTDILVNKLGAALTRVTK